jgi:dTDP-4-amino-4,6-dideoxygalactose transaminase
MTQIANEHWPFYEDDEIAAAMAVLRSGHPNYWGGQEGRAFECEFANAIGVDYAVAMANGTLALEAALRAVGIGPGDEVVVTARSFVASASSVAMVGARPVFADIEGESQNVDADTIAAVLTPATRAVVVVHLTGWPCEMDAINALAMEYGVWVIEDCAQAHGARYRGRSVGALGHVAAWSFCQDKIISTGGEGGMVTTSDPAIAERVWSVKDHGRDRREVVRTDHPPGFHWLIDRKSVV